MAYLDGWFWNTEDPRAQQAYGALGQLGVSLMARGMGDRAGAVRAMQGAMAAPYLIQSQQADMRRNAQAEKLREQQIAQNDDEVAAQKSMSEAIAAGKSLSDPAVRAELAKDPAVARMMLRQQLGGNMFAPRPVVDLKTGNTIFAQGSPFGGFTPVEGYAPLPNEGLVMQGGQLQPAPGYIPSVQAKTAAQQPAYQRYEGMDPSGAPTVGYTENPSARVPWWAQPNGAAGRTQSPPDPKVVGPGIGARETMKAEATNVPEAARTRYSMANKQLDVIDSLVPIIEKFKPDFWTRAAGSVGFYGPEGKEAESARNSMLFAIAQLSDQGALQAPDRAVAESMIGQMFDPRIGPETRAANMKSFKAWIEAQRKSSEVSVSRAAPLSAPTVSDSDRSLLDKYAPR